jgi:hypothetical protein
MKAPLSSSPCWQTASSPADLALAIPVTLGPCRHHARVAYDHLVSLTPPPDPPLPDDDDPAVHAGHVNVLADELARLFGLVPLAVREQAAQAALDVVNRHLNQQQHSGGRC